MRSTRQNNEISEGRKVSCPKVRFRRRGCTSRYECKEECKEKKSARPLMNTSARTIGDKSARMCGRTSVMGRVEEEKGAVKEVEVKEVEEDLTG